MFDALVILIAMVFYTVYHFGILLRPWEEQQRAAGKAADLTTGALAVQLPAANVALSYNSQVAQEVVEKAPAVHRVA